MRPRQYSISSLILLIISGLCCFTAGGAAAQEDNRPISIGLLADLSGPSAVFGTEARIGFEMARQTLEKTGIKVDVVVEDTASDTSKAISAAQKLLTIDKVDAVFTELSHMASAVSPVVRQNRKLFLYLGGATSILSTNPWAFKSSIDFTAAGSLLGRYLKKEAVQQAAMIYLPIESSELTASGFKETFPEMLDLPVKSPMEELSTPLLRIKRAAAGAVLSSAFEAGFSQLLKDALSLKYEGLLATYSFNLNQAAISRYQALMPRVVLIGLRPLPQSFLSLRTSMAQPSSDVAMSWAAMAFVHVQQIVRALSACNRQDPDCQVNKLSMEPEDPIIGFRGFRDRQAQMDLLISRWQDGKFSIVP